MAVIFALFQRIPVASGAHCVKVHVRYLISWWVLVIFGADHWQQQVMSLWRHNDGSRTRSKVKCLFVALYNSNSTLRRSGMARVNDGSHSFICHPHVCTQLERIIPASLLQPQSVFDWYWFSVPLIVEGWVGPSGWSQNEVVYPPTDSHSSQY